MKKYTIPFLSLVILIALGVLLSFFLGNSREKSLDEILLKSLNYYDSEQVQSGEAFLSYEIEMNIPAEPELSSAPEEIRDFLLSMAGTQLNMQLNIGSTWQENEEGEPDMKYIADMTLNIPELTVLFGGPQNLTIEFVVLDEMMYINLLETPDMLSMVAPGIAEVLAPAENNWITIPINEISSVLESDEYGDIVEMYNIEDMTDTEIHEMNKNFASIFVAQDRETITHPELGSIEKISSNIEAEALKNFISSLSLDESFEIENIESIIQDLISYSFAHLDIDFYIKKNIVEGGRFALSFLQEDKPEDEMITFEMEFHVKNINQDFVIEAPEETITLFDIFGSSFMDIVSSIMSSASMLGPNSNPDDMIVKDIILSTRGELSDGDLTLDDNSLYHVHTFFANNKQNIDILLESSEFDTYLILLDPQNIVVMENDDYTPMNTNSRITFTPQLSGMHSVLVNSFDQNGRGSYELLIREVE